MFKQLKKQEIIGRSIEQELTSSYMSYAMSVIISRALPDVRDGCKPVHRRILYAMHKMGNDSDKPHKKSVRVCGDVSGKYHPHGDGPVYDSIVRMTQTFASRYPLIEGQGNFGSMDGDAPAAMRYTGIRLSAIAELVLKDLDKNTVNFIENYDNTETMPEVLPASVPNLLVNGSSGIAVGMATNIPPHNLNEVIDAVVAFLKDNTLDSKDLMQYVQGPDFPTGGVVYGQDNLEEVYNTGRGSITLRARHIVEKDEKNLDRIVITELPYQVNKSTLVQQIALLAGQKKIKGISSVQDESDKEGMRICIGVQKFANTDVILNNLYKETQLQTFFHMNMVALVNNSPSIMSLRSIIEAFVQHRCEIVTKRNMYELDKARARIHILEGLSVALININQVVNIIRNVKSSQLAHQMLKNSKSLSTEETVITKTNVDRSLLSAKESVQGEYYVLSDEQINSILDMRLSRLTSLEQDKLTKEYVHLSEIIVSSLSVLQNKNKLLEVIENELLEIKAKHYSPRLTDVCNDSISFNVDDFIIPEQVVVSMSQEGYVKTQALEEYSVQRRGGMGKTISSVKEEDAMSSFCIASTRDYMLCFSNLGQVFWIKVHELPRMERVSKGKPMCNFLPLDANEHITSMMPLSDFHDKNILMVTKLGIVKRVDLQAFAKPRKGGIKAIVLQAGDSLKHTLLTHGDGDIMLFSNGGKAVRFHESEVRVIGRQGQGVIGMKLAQDESIVGALLTDKEAKVLAVTANGYGKVTPVQFYRKTKRGSKGVIAISASARNGNMIGAKIVNDNSEIMLMTAKGLFIRIITSDIRVCGRTAQGVKLANLKPGDTILNINMSVEG